MRMLRPPIEIRATYPEADGGMRIEWEEFETMKEAEEWMSVVRQDEVHFTITRNGESS